MKTIVVPDVHNKTHLVDDILKYENHFDRVIILGDVFDHFNDTAQIAKEVATWVKTKLQDSRFVFLWGNHDVHYGVRSRKQYCSGYSIEKDMAIWEVLNDNDFAKWRYFWFESNFLLTHAGLHGKFLPPLWKRVDTQALQEFLSKEQELCREAFQQAYGEHWFALFGDARNRTPRGVPIGGILWCDANEEFEPIKGLSQIFGHTYQSVPTFIFGETGLGRINDENTVLKMRVKANMDYNLALDCSLRYYAIIRDDILKIKKTPH